MSWRDTRTSYGWGSIVFHWLGAALVITLYLTGEEVEDAVQGAGEDAAHALHVSIGVIALVILVPRILRRWFGGEVSPVVSQGWILDTLARWIPRLLLILIAVLLITGPLSIWANGRPIDVFGLLSIPSPMPRVHDLHEALEEVHETASGPLLPLVALHVLGALKHLIVDRDGTFGRMLRPRRAT